MLVSKFRVEVNVCVLFNPHPNFFTDFFFEREREGVWGRIERETQRERETERQRCEKH